MRRAALAAAGLSLWLAVAPPRRRMSASREGTVMFVGAPGEANAVTVAAVAVLGGSGVRVHDAGAELFAGYRCETLSLNEAICRNGPLANDAEFLLAADLGDGDDSVRIEPSFFEPIPGLRVEEGLDGPAVLRGGSGNDVIVGGDEVDEIDGGLGNDRIDGRGGPDVLHYKGRTQSLRIDLVHGIAGERGERDEISNMEFAVGGRAADTMIANPQACADDGDGGLDGGPGNDHLIGSRCGDWLAGQRGDDLLEGRSGDDLLWGDSDCRSRRPRGVSRHSDDTVIGGAGDDEMCERFGRNHLLGGLGADRLIRGRGRDDFAAGAGDDQIQARDRRAEVVDCGHGRGDTLDSDDADRRRSCEIRRALPALR